MSCVREASPSPTSAESDISTRQDVKKKRFHPLRGLRRIFRRKGRPACVASDARSNDRLPNSDDELGFNQVTKIRDEDDDGNPVTLESSRCHSTSHLTDDPETQRRNFSSTVLSVSHDSVFTAEQRSPNSGSESSIYNRRLGFPHSSVRAELFEVVRRRRVCESNGGSDDEDLGLPRSSVSSSPTAATEDIFSKANVVTKSSQSICSDASLLSIGSYDIDEQEFTVRSSRHSSKLSLHEKRYPPAADAHEKSSPGSEKITNTSSSKDGSGLCHNAAKHKLAIKPKRTHGLPHKKKQMIANTLPSTPELIEDGSSSKNSAASEEKPSDQRRESAQFEKSALIETVVALPPTDDSSPTTALSSTCENNYQQQQRADRSSNEACSLPSGVTLTAPTAVRLCRSKSNVTANSGTATATRTGSDENNFFVRLLSKRGSKKKRTGDNHSPTENDGDSLDIERSLVPNERQLAGQTATEEQQEEQTPPVIASSEKEFTDEAEAAAPKTPNRSAAVQRKRLRSADSFKIYRKTDVLSERGSKVRSKSDSFSSDVDAAALPIPMPEAKRNGFEIKARSAAAERQPSSSSSSLSSSTSSVNKCRTSFRRQRMEPLNLGLDEDVLVSASIAPSSALKKSFSFCERENTITATAIDRSPPPPLPVEDTISLPVDIGRIIKDTTYHLENCTELTDVSMNDSNSITPSIDDDNDCSAGDDYYNNGADDNYDDHGDVTPSSPSDENNKNDRDTSTVFVRCLSAAAGDISPDAMASSDKNCRSDCGDVSVKINLRDGAQSEQNNNGITIDIVSSDRKPLPNSPSRLQQQQLSQKLIVSVNGGVDGSASELDEGARNEIGLNNDSGSANSSNDFSPLRRILQISAVDNSINRTAIHPAVTITSNPNNGSGTGGSGLGSAGGLSPNSLSPNKPVIASRLTVHEHATNNNTSSSSAVVLRRKKSKECVESRTDDEPELMKVFARRSLKLKESDDIVGGTDGSSPTGASAAVSTKSRDSDKENEGSDSPPPEGRKKKDTVAGDALSASVGTGGSPIVGQLQQKSPGNNEKNSVNSNAGYKFGPSSIISNNNFQRFQKNANFNGAATADQAPFNNRYQLQRSKTSPILSDDGKPSDTKTAVVHYQRSLSKESPSPPASNDHQLLKSVTVQSAGDHQDNSSNSLPFKRIQQRREEWEKRAQLAMKVQYH